MAVLCPRCGEYSSIIDEHCKKCGFSIKNYVENQKRLGKECIVENEVNGSSSICLKEKESMNRDVMTSLEKSEEIQQNIMRLLSNIKIVPGDENKQEEENVDVNVQAVLEEALQDSSCAVSKNNSVSTKDEDINENKNKDDVVSKKENTLAKKEHVKIIAKKVADDVIIFPPNRVKVEIEAAKNITKGILEELSEEVSDEIVEDRIKKIREELAKNQEFIDKLEDMGMRKEENALKLGDSKNDNNDAISENDICTSNKIIEDKEENEDIEETEEERKVREEREAREAEIYARAIPSTEGYSFREFVKENRENNISKKATLIVGGAIVVVVLLIVLLTFSATAAIR